MFVLLWYAVGTLATLLLGASLLARGWRGRRHGDEPRCRKCEYDLTLLDSEQCPECGTKLGRRTTVHGARQRSWVLVASGGLLLMLGLLSSQSTLLELGARRHALFPLRMLVDRAVGGDQQSMFEIERRIKDRQLSEAQGHRLADRALGWVGSKPDAYDPWWRRLIDLDEADFLLDDHRKRMAALSASPYLYTRDDTRQGDPVVAQISFAVAGLPQYSRRFEPTEIRIGDRVIYRRGMKEDRLEELEPASDEPVLDIQRYVLDSADLPSGPTTLVIDGFSRFVGSWESPDLGEASRSKKERLEASIDILPRDTRDPVTWSGRMHLFPSMLRRFRLSVTGGCFSECWSKPGSWSGAVFEIHRVGEFYHIPIRGELRVPTHAPLAMQFIVEAGGVELPIELLHVLEPCHHPRNAIVVPVGRRGKIEDHIAKVPLFDADEFYIILRSSKDVARRTLMMYSVWQGELRYGPFPVRHDVVDASP